MFFEHLGPFWAPLLFSGPPGALLGAFWGLLGPSWGPPGGTLGTSWAALGHFCALWAALGVLLGSLSALLGRPWALLWAPATLPEPIFDLPGCHFPGFLVNSCASRALRDTIANNAKHCSKSLVKKSFDTALGQMRGRPWLGGRFWGACAQLDPATEPLGSGQAV